MKNEPLFTKLKHRIIFLENTNPIDLGGEIWLEKLTTFAEIKPLYDNKVGSIESFNFGHIVTEGYFMFRIRALEGINTKMRISFKNRLFEIKRILDIDEEGKMLKIIALEV
jgi:head-tail adaptor